MVALSDAAPSIRGRRDEHSTVSVAAPAMHRGSRSAVRVAMSFTACVLEPAHATINVVTVARRIAGVDDQ